MLLDFVCIPVTIEEIATVCEALRYQADNMTTIATSHRQQEINNLRFLAERLADRCTAAASAAAHGGSSF